MVILLAQVVAIITKSMPLLDTDLELKLWIGCVKGNKHFRICDWHGVMRQLSDTDGMHLLQAA